MKSTRTAVGTDRRPSRSEVFHFLAGQAAKDSDAEISTVTESTVVSRGVFGVYKRVLYMDYAKTAMQWNKDVTTIKDLLDALNFREDADPHKGDLERRLVEAVAIIADATRPVSQRVEAARSAGFDVAFRGPEDRPRRVVFRGPGGSPRVTYMYPRGKTARKRLHDAEEHHNWQQNRFVRAD